MIFDKQWRANRIKVRLAGVMATLDTELINVEKGTPFSQIMVGRLIRELAELKEKLRQLESK